MVICGIKLTHDGALALIDNGSLVFSIEMEKIKNFPRHANFCISWNEVETILGEYGYNVKDIDRFVIDGWDNWDSGDFGVNATSKGVIEIPIDHHPSIRITELAAYGHLVSPQEDILECQRFKTPDGSLVYNSYQHVSGHVMSAYCTSPFADKKEDSLVMVWDGGMPPQLFYFNHSTRKIDNLGYLFFFTGYIYINFAHAFKPFNQYEKHMSIAGKAMAYMAIGKVQEEIVNEYWRIYHSLVELTKEITLNIDGIAATTQEFITKAQLICETEQWSHDDMLSSFQYFMQELLVRTLQERTSAYTDKKNLCLTGGCALNIKWNNRIRNGGIFKDVWVPPFPNDSGSALGTACCEMAVNNGKLSLDWNVYQGPAFGSKTDYDKSYETASCSLKELAAVIHRSNQPILFLHGPAELGPRALGHRSILSSASDPKMKDRLNLVKGREGYRPVAPMCIEEDAPEIFNPGTPDPYMLFEHSVREEWTNKVPAICHLDGTARLQTVSNENNPIVYELLLHYKQLSGIPLICNTSANLSGKGFFPDLKTATNWGKVNFIWCDGLLYFKNVSITELTSFMDSSSDSRFEFNPHQLQPTITNG